MTLPLTLRPSTPLDYFRSLVESDEHFPLLEAAVSLAQDEYATLDVQQVLADVDALLLRLRQRLPADAPAMHKLRLLNLFIYDELHFAGNVNHYYDPDNSYLHHVLMRRRGIPVSLAVLWLELARGLGLSAHGVGFPGHFMVKVNLPQAQVVIDPFNGRSQSRSELQERLDTWHGHSDMSDMGRDDDLLLAHYLRPLEPREILARMLRNLKEIHCLQQDWARMVAVEDRLLVLLPQAWDEYRDRGLAHAELGHRADAVDDLSTYLAHASAQGDAERIAQRLAELQQR
jgi:regulator of sirC expression with transglutaminase-like and TPR domain